MSESKHEAGLDAARRYSGWYIGSRGWADKIIHAYLNPAEAEEDMDKDKIPQITGSWREY